MPAEDISDLEKLEMVYYLLLQVCFSVIFPFPREQS